MPPPPPAPEPAKPTPPVCVCGYDLAGLPVDAGAKCPECGAVFDPASMSGPMLRRYKRLGVLVALPSVAGAVGIPVVGILSRVIRPVVPFAVAFIVWLVLWIASIAAAVARARMRTRHGDEERRYSESLAAFFVSLIGQPVASLVACFVGIMVVQLVAAACRWVIGS